jgi:hypothetical protein
VSIGSEYGRSGAGAGRRAPRAVLDPAEEVALVARAKRELLLSASRHRLRREDLEDCYSQATLEMLMRVRGGGTFANRRHLGNALELRFQSRIRDRRRAISGRSPMQAALETAVPLQIVGEAGVEIADASSEVEQLVMLRLELRRLGVLARELTSDQRLVLASQVAAGSREEFCREHGWSFEKYRKVGQRARVRLRSLLELEGADVPPAVRQSER